MLLKKLLPALLICLFTQAATAQSDKVSEYINNFKELAIREMIRTGVPASITLAQGILESQSGESQLAKKSNNHFGIKCKNDWTGEKVYHDDDARGECFRSYPSAEQSYIDHSDFLKTRAHYAFLFTLDPTDYEGWAKGLKKAGYATNPAYAQRLIDLINRYNLQQYTLIALQRVGQKDSQSFAMTEGNVSAQISTLSLETETAVETVEVVEVAQESATITPAASDRTAIYNAADYPQSPFTINATRVILAREGTSLLALADEFRISYKKLLEFNELDESTNDILEFDQLIFLAKKPKKGSKDFHVVEANETLEVIAQKEGVQLEALFAYNRIPKGRQPQVGEKIYLKANSPVTPKLVESSARN